MYTTISIIIALLSIGVSAQAFRGNQNLWLHENGKNLQSTSVTLSINEDLTNPKGLKIAFSCASPKASSFSLQRFLIEVDPSQSNVLVGQVATWSGSNLQLQINAAVSILTNISTPATIPAGSNLQIQLNNVDNGDITSVEFSITQSNALLGTGTIDLGEQNLTSGSSALANLSPIMACTSVIVGFGDDNNATFSSGSGTITYSSQNRLTSSIDIPPGSLLQADVGDTETSNVEYGKEIVSKNNSSFHTQTFKVPQK